MPKKPWGPPRKAQHVTGSHPAFARAVALGLAGAEATDTARGSDFAVGGELFLTLTGEFADVHRAGEDTQRIVVNQVPRDDVRWLIEEAWASSAPKPAVTAHRRRRAAFGKRTPITEDDIRAIVLRLPGANEGPIWGNDPGFRVGDEKRTRFARFGPPEGSRIGNLLPPDDEHALLVFHCEHRPSLLAAAADRFFTTPHYGDPDEPGSVIVRLPELRGREHLAEITELLEDAWRTVAPSDAVAQFDAWRVDAPRARRSGGASGPAARGR